MSTRRTQQLWFDRIHVFRDVLTGATCVDIGKHSYNRAWRLWLLPFKRIY